MLGLKVSHRVQKTEGSNNENVQIPNKNINWATQGKTTPIKNQEQCGSCWAFSAVETVESANLMAGRGAAPGSPQELVDCDTNDQGCNGGDPREALNWIQSIGGLETESCYPYNAVQGVCDEPRCSPAYTISSIIDVPPNEHQIYDNLEAHGPLSICCDAMPWQNYQGGILHAKQCGNEVDHAIQLVGYSHEKGGYWIVRNSWGAEWGINGFIYLQFGHNTCNMKSLVTGATA